MKQTEKLLVTFNHPKLGLTSWQFTKKRAQQVAKLLKDRWGCFVCIGSSKGHASKKEPV